MLAESQTNSICSDDAMTSGSSLMATMGIGFALGLRHALDTDHLVAVSTLVARERSVWRSTRIGAVWGLGHTATLFAIGLIIVLFGLHIPDGIASYLKAAVAVMLIALGIRSLYPFFSGQGHICGHEHEESKNGHIHVHRVGGHQCSEVAVPKPALKKDRAGGQSFWVGVVHGLNGSAELMLLVLATIRHPFWALVYIAIFGMGMMVAMFVLTTLLALTLGLTSRFKDGWHHVDNGLRALTGATSLGFGCYLLWQSFGVQ